MLGTPKSIYPFPYLSLPNRFFQVLFVARRSLFAVLIGLFPFQHLLSQMNYNPLLVQGDPGSEPARNLIASNERFCEMEYLFNGFTVTEKEQDGKTYHYIHIDGFGKMTEVGKPALPSHTDVFALAKGKKIDIQVIDAVFKDYPGFMVHPALSPASDEVGAPEPVFKIDEDQYQKNEFYPAHNVVQSNTYFLRGLPLAL
ncbi:MAG TPA: hypothetical protein EYM84_04185, partial [Flavobacteriales bacterium]|nr:hypothetical protein [Flavobacteriales bacterium]